LTPRDLWALSWILEQYAISLEQLQTLLGRRAGPGTKEAQVISESAMRQVLARWLKRDYVEQKNVFTHQAPWIWPSRRAVSELGMHYPYYTPHIGTLPHLHAITHVRLYLEGLHPHDMWRSERAIKAARPRYALGSEPPHTPDAEVRSASTQEITAIEVELSQKKAADLQHILNDLGRRYSSVWYFALKDPYRAVSDVLATQGEALQDKIKLYRLEDIHGYTPITL
jgi:hypothetical protein